MKNKIKVAIDTTYMDRRPGKGTAIVLRHTVEELIRFKNVFDITLIHRESIPEDSVYREFKEIIIPRINFPKWSGFLSELRFFLTTQEKFDVYFFAYSRVYPTFWLAPAKKIIFNAMDGGPQTAGFKRRGYGKSQWYIKLFKRHIDVFLALSEFGKEGIIKTFKAPSSKVRVVYNGVGNSFRQPKDTELNIQDLQTKYSLPYPYILDVSRFDPHKNIIGLIRAYAILVKKGFKEHLVFVGGKHIPSYSEDVEKEIQKLGIGNRVSVMPFIDDMDMYRIYGAASVMAFPSFYEGFGLPVIEAQACGTPVVISNIDALTEIAGGSAEIVDPHDVDSIAVGIEKVLTEQSFREDLIKKGKENAMRFTWKSHGDTVARIFTEFDVNI